MTNREAVDWLNEGMIAEARIPGEHYLLCEFAPYDDVIKSQVQSLLSKYEPCAEGIASSDAIPLKYFYAVRDEDLISSCLFHK